MKHNETGLKEMLGMAIALCGDCNADSRLERGEDGFGFAYDLSKKISSLMNNVSVQHVIENTPFGDTWAETVDRCQLCNQFCKDGEDYCSKACQDKAEESEKPAVNPIFAMIDARIPPGTLIAARTKYCRQDVTDLIVLVYMGHNTVTPWVVWGLSIFSDGSDGGCYDGDYFESESKAMLRFQER